MKTRRIGSLEAALAAAVLVGAAQGQDRPGSLTGIVTDADIGGPVSAATLQISGFEPVQSDSQGSFSFPQLPAGTYALVASKNGFLRQRVNVVVRAGQISEVEVALAGDLTEMEEFVVQDVLQMGGGTEAGLLELRLDSPSLMDSIGADLMSRAGASDAAGALRLVAGASVQDGKFAVIRGLPDRYVVSQMNGVRLPSADADTRAVELDQFPSAIIESVQVSKTFTPDQQGDASGGAVNVQLKGVPTEPFFLQMRGQYSFNSQVRNRDDFLGYDGGGLNTFGRDDGRRNQQLDNLGSGWDGAVGANDDHAPIDHKWSIAGGGKYDVTRDLRIGGFGSVFYERDSSYVANGIDDSWWVERPDEGLVPRSSQGRPSDGDFKTSLFDVRRATRSVRWGSLATVGAETDNHSLDFTYLYTRAAEDSATIATDTRGKQFFFPGYDPDDPTTPGHGNADSAPYLRNETLKYTERTTETFQLHGNHKLPLEDSDVLKAPEFDWILSSSTADRSEPDERQFGAQWFPGRRVSRFELPPSWRALKPGANIQLGNLQRIWETVEEESEQYSASLKLPFEQWTGDEGYLKIGVFGDDVTRTFDQDSFGNFDQDDTVPGLGFDQPWSRQFPYENRPITESLFDVDYNGQQKIEAYYLMADVPLYEDLKLIGGVRFESTKIGIQNLPDYDPATPDVGPFWYYAPTNNLLRLLPPDQRDPMEPNPDADFSSDDVLPSISFEFEPIDGWILRGAYSRTVARQVFKELAPVLQQDYLGAPIFIGNPDLQMSKVENFDLRLDYVPYEGGLVSVSWFRKDIEDPIEYVERVVNLLNFTTAINYPKGRLEGFEFEIRQDAGKFLDVFEGLSFGANATLIDSEVTLSEQDQAGFASPGILAPMTTRDMTNAPEHLYNLFLTYDIERTGTTASVFYTVQGDTLVSGAGQDGDIFVPNIYQLEYETLNVSLRQALGDVFTLQLQAKNLTNPDIETAYRSEYILEDVTRQSFTRGIEYSISLSARVQF